MVSSGIASIRPPPKMGAVFRKLTATVLGGRTSGLSAQPGTSAGNSSATVRFMITGAPSGWSTTSTRKVVDVVTRKRVSKISEPSPTVLEPPAVGWLWHSAQLTPLKSGPSPVRGVNTFSNSALPAWNLASSSAVSPGRGSPNPDGCPGWAPDVIPRTKPAPTRILARALLFRSIGLPPLTGTPGHGGGASAT